jgi:hypothetical protein
VLDAGNVHLLVLCVPHERTATTLPPREIRVETDPVPTVEPRPRALPSRWEALWSEPQLLSQGNSNEGLEHLVHVNHEPGSVNRSAPCLRSRRAQDQLGELERRPIVGVEPRRAEIWDLVGAVVDQRHGVHERALEDGQLPTNGGVEQRQPRQAVQRGPEHPVGIDVLGEVVVSHLDGDELTGTPSNLLVDPDSTTNSCGRLFHCAIAL